jgi:hypothetical protein
MSYVKSIRLCGKNKILCCDGLCEKAFGPERPKRVLGDGRVELRTDSEIGIKKMEIDCAPLSEWCLNECERAFIGEINGEVFESPEF